MSEPGAVAGEGSAMRDLEREIELLAQEALMFLRAALAEIQARALTMLIDPTLKDPLGESAEMRQALKDGSARRIGLPVIHTDIAPDRTPYLIHIGDEERAERLFNKSLYAGVAEAIGAWGADYRGRSVCAWFIAEEDPSALARRLADTARVRRPDGAFWPLRLWDPRVLWHLPRVLSPAQRQRVCLIAERWLYIDTLGRLRRASELPLVDTNSLPAELPLGFDAAGWSALERVGVINAALDMAFDWGMQRSQELAARIDRLLMRCEEHGYTTEQDGLVFVASALTSHEQFDSHPAVATALSEGASRNTSLAEVLADLDDAFWAELSQGRWPPVGNGIDPSNRSV